ncbi:hypothetical protein QBC32DRAFT_362120 [Pseudoneurospora amorphoporcata]|uniref:Uncharacterized protein n=1 Tax=Pseudoneurospora amorphoporcata TaxID=241081 RepID=A0AAN6NU04_9PEZI|nr:hypothetical protein QBC32DRAFT_362120 [Pseudoneurospora amorphoporcata]
MGQTVAPPLTSNGGIVGTSQGLRLSQMNKQTPSNVERLYQEGTARSVRKRAIYTILERYRRQLFPIEATGCSSAPLADWPPGQADYICLTPQRSENGTKFTPI